MGWRGVLRSLQAEPRKEGAAHRKQRELERQSQQLTAMAAQERAAHEVAAYETHLELLLSIHKECGPAIDWNTVHKARPPLKPVLEHRRAALARLAFQTYKPSLLAKWLRRAQPKVYELAQAARQAQEADLQAFRDASERYRQDYPEWEAAQALAGKVLAGDADGYARAIREAAPFSDFSIFGSEIHFSFRPEMIGVELRVRGKAAVPAETKTLRAGGGLSVELMPRSRWLKVYQDFVCGSALRVGRELFALLPISRVIVNAMGDVLNPETGYLQARTILSVALPRKSLAEIDWESVHPSAAMAHFVHRMSFTKSTAFEPVEPLTFTEAGLGAGS
jgi:hypothetical protein